MNIVDFFFVLVWLYLSASYIYVIHLPIFIMVISLALGQSHDCPNVSDITMTEVAKQAVINP